MQVSFAYAGRSRVLQPPGKRWQALSLVPNLTRDPVAFDAPLRQPLRFREAMSALHDTVISDLRFKKRDKTAYLEWKKQEGARERVVRREALRVATDEALAKHGLEMPEGLEQTFEQKRRRYWDARQKYSDYLRRSDPALWRMLMPCDPVITVADDVVFFECFSADESSYGCLTVNRGDGFGESESVRLGTTNVDYSWDLYNHFQSLRSYRETRFTIDPAGFEVATGEVAGHREEKIDLPNSWLRGFLQIQSAMTMSPGRVTLSRECVYAILAWYKRHKARRSPRAIRFELLNGKPPRVLLEPWEQAITSHGTTYDGPDVEPIRVWGGRRLTVLARVLPLVERFDVYLLGTGLPSFWVAQMGEMRLTLGLSGWTVNDWTRSAALDLLAPPAAPAPDTVDNVAAIVRERAHVDLAALQQRLQLDAKHASQALRELANAGQVIYDLEAGVYRWRQIMPKAIGQAEIGPEHPELTGARELMEKGARELTSREDVPTVPGGYLLSGKIDYKPVEILVDADGRIRRGKCLCGHFKKYALKNGPCRHMLALRWTASVPALEAYRASSWYNRFRVRRKDEG
jgi:hypothetical protein